MNTPPGYCSLEPAYIIKLFVTASNPVGDIWNGSNFVHYEQVGSMSTFTDYSGPRCDGQVVCAGDRLYIDPSQQYATVNARGIVLTSSGASVGFSWTGYATLDDSIRAIMQHAPEARTTPFGKLTTVNSFEVGDPDLRSLGTTNFVGSGRYFTKNGQMGVELRISRVVAPFCDD